MNVKKVIICDLDGTLAKSKSELSPEMAKIVENLLKRYFLVVISGGSFSQFQKQFLSHLSCPPESLQNLYIFPTMGSTCYFYSEGAWKQIYEESLNDDERALIKQAINETISESDQNPEDIYGDLIDDRGTQITYSARGQNAPLEVKEKWDTDQAKRRAVVKILERKIPQFEIRIGGATSIDITKKGIDKAFAVKKVKEILKVQDEDIIFIGDALYQGGNDAPVKSTAIDYIQASGPEETATLLMRYL